MTPVISCLTQNMYVNLNFAFQEGLNFKQWVGIT